MKEPASLGRWWRTLRPLPVRSHVERGVNEARKRLWLPVLPGLVAIWQRQGAQQAAKANVAALRNLGAALESTPPPAVAELLAGRLVLAGREVAAFPPEDWQLPGARPLEVYEAHYLDWVDALTAAAVRSPMDAANGGGALALAGAALGRWNLAAPHLDKAWEPYPRARRTLACLRAAARLTHLAHHGRDRLRPQHRELGERLLATAAAAAAGLGLLAERHLGGNHLLCDRIAAACASAVFGGSEAATAALAAECERQFARDGSHVEASPMYHALAIEDLLGLQRLRADSPNTAHFQLDPLLARACAWLAAVRHPDGHLPAFGDSDPDALVHLHLTRTALAHTPPGRTDPRLSAWTSRRGAHFAIVHTAPPAYAPQPGHAHADQLSVEWSWRDTRIFGDAGLCGYEGDANRSLNRSAASHSTLDIPGVPSTELWSTFRVGARGRMRHLQWGEQGAWHWLGAIFEWPAGTHRHLRFVAHAADGHLVIADRLRAAAPPDAAIGRLLLAPGVTWQTDQTLHCAAGNLQVATNVPMEMHEGLRFLGRGATWNGPELRYPVTCNDASWLHIGAPSHQAATQARADLTPLWHSLAAQLDVG